MNAKTTTQSTKKAYQREIEGLSYLKNFQNQMVQIDFIPTNGACETQFMEDLIVIGSTRYITLGCELESTNPLRLLKEQILDIDELSCNQVSILITDGEYIISRM